MDTGGENFWIVENCRTSSQQGNDPTPYVPNTELTNNEPGTAGQTQLEVIFFTVPANAPDVLYYEAVDPDMTGKFIIADAILRVEDGTDKDFIISDDEHLDEEEDPLLVAVRGEDLVIVLVDTGDKTRSSW